MSKVKLCVGFLFFSSFMSSMHAQTPPPVVLFWEEARPPADTAAPSRAQLCSALPNARYASAHELGEALGREESRLLMLPFGSAFPEESWEVIEAFLERGRKASITSQLSSGNADPKGSISRRLSSRPRASPSSWAEA